MKLKPVSTDSSILSKMLFVYRSYMKGQGKILLFALLAGATSAGMAGFGVPLMTEKVFPIVFGQKEMPEVVQMWLSKIFNEDQVGEAVLWLAALGFPLIMVLKGIAQFCNVYLMSKAGLRILEKLRLNVFDRLQELPLSFLEKNKRGDLLSRIIHDCQFLQDGVLRILNDLVIQPFTLIAAFSYLLFASMNNDQVPMLLLNILIAMGCVPIVKKIGTRMVKSTGKAFAGLGDITSDLQENLSAQKDVRAFCLEQAQHDSLQEKIQKFFKMMLRMVLYQQSITPAVEIMSALGLAFSLYIATAEGLTLAQFSAIAIALYYCYEPIKKLGAVQNQFKLNGLMIDRLNQVVLAENTMPEPENPESFNFPEGNISYKNVSFAYNEDNLVLQNVSLEVPKGQIVALVGPSGSGKTTMINLLCRFYDVNEGSISIDGHDVRHVAKRDLRSAIGLVSQMPLLFSISIRDNILLGKPGASDEEVYQAARAASVDEFTQILPQGYDTVLGEDGEGLSGGQRQRVSIARAFLKNAPILILDEATASLDMASEARIQDSLQHLTEGRTTFIIAHRFSTLRLAHRILVMDQGRIVADGSHEELYESSAQYKALYDKQMMP